MQSSAHRSASVTRLIAPLYSIRNPSRACSSVAFLLRVPLGSLFRAKLNDLGGAGIQIMHYLLLLWWLVLTSQNSVGRP